MAASQRSVDYLPLQIDLVEKEIKELQRPWLSNGTCNSRARLAIVNFDRERMLIFYRFGDSNYLAHCTGF